MKWLDWTWIRRAPLALLLLTAGCTNDLRSRLDASVDSTSDMTIAGPCDSQHPCPPSGRCYLGMCIEDNGGCGSDEDCENDTWCDCAEGSGSDAGVCTGVCIPWGLGARGGFDPSCHGMGFPASAFQAPVDACHYSLPNGISSPVLMTPLVVDLDLDGSPEIIFTTFNSAPIPGTFVAIHGKDCSTYFYHPDWSVFDCSQMAAADLDGDKYPELVGIEFESPNDPRIAVWNHLGALLAKSPQRYQNSWQGGDCSGVAIADVDGDGTPELLAGGQVARYHKGSDKLEVVWDKPPSTKMTAHWGTLSLFADMDGDGHPEAVTGLKVYDGLTGEDKTPSAMADLDDTGAYPQVADFNGDKKPDLLIVQSQPGKQKVTIIDYSSNQILFGPYGVTGSLSRPGGWGGPATVADFDGDGVPDFGIASDDHYFVYALKCARKPLAKECTGTDPGVLWERKTQDVSSGGTASSVFDFNGDGRAEVVYRDECWLRVMNGADGKTLFARSITSGTALEMPVVADVDGDGHADLIVPSDIDANCLGVDEGQTGQQHGPSTEGIFVMRDPMNRWMGSRALWNQHTYHITNISDNLTVPRVETANWLGWNNYRQNVQGTAGNSSPAPDFTGGNTAPIDNGGRDCKVSERLWANLCNRGASTAAPGVPGAFYTADPRSSSSPPLCVAMTTISLYPGGCEAVHCDWGAPSGAAIDLWFRADDSGSGKPPEYECKSDNDLLFLPRAQCYIPG